MPFSSDGLEEKLQQLKGVEPPDAIGQERDAPEPKPTESKVATKRSDAAEQKIRAAKLQNDGVEEQQKRAQTDHEKYWEFRTDFGSFAKWNVAIWQACILAVVILHGARLLKVDRTILLTLITTTTINVFTFLIIVMKFVFSKSPAQPDAK